MIEDTNFTIALSIPRLAAAAHVSRSVVYDAMKKRELEFIQLGRRRLVTPEAARKWLARYVVSAAA